MIALNPIFTPAGRGRTSNINKAPRCVTSTSAESKFDFFIFKINLLRYYRDNFLQVVWGYFPSLQPGKQHLIGLFEETTKRGLFIGKGQSVSLFQKTQKQQVEFKQSTPALPAQTPQVIEFF
jgi:hypothetical protein